MGGTSGTRRARREAPCFYPPASFVPALSSLFLPAAVCPSPPSTRSSSPWVLRTTTCPRSTGPMRLMPPPFKAKCGGETNRRPRALPVRLETSWDCPIVQRFPSHPCTCSERIRLLTGSTRTWQNLRVRRRIQSSLTSSFQHPNGLLQWQRRSIQSVSPIPALRSLCLGFPLPA